MEPVSSRVGFSEREGRSLVEDVGGGWFWIGGGGGA